MKKQLNEREEIKELRKYLKKQGHYDLEFRDDTGNYTSYVISNKFKEKGFSLWAIDIKKMKELGFEILNIYTNNGETEVTILWNKQTH